MATEAAPNVNGTFDGQYNQPAELAASSPSHTNASQTQPSSSAQQKADPQEIGWYFVEQYYTTLSKTPERIHLFYSKKSQLVTGAEAEKIVPAVGTKAISEKIKNLDIQDCKVRVLNVDSQSSFDNIVVQVIGQLSNKSQPHHKFVQTFVLATQPNGYFVLNDIFRYLSDEEDEIIEDQPAEDPVQVSEQVAPQPEEPAEVETKASEELVDNEAAAQVVDEKLEESAQEPTVVEEQGPNGVDAEPETAEAVTEEEATEPTPTEATTVPAVEEPPAPEPTPAVEAPTKPLTDAAPAKKTWASLVGNKAPAIPALPATTPAVGQSKATKPAQAGAAPKAPVEAASPSNAGSVTGSTSTNANATATTTTPPPAATTAQTSAQNNGWQTADHGKKAKGPQQKSTEGTVYAYIKNVTDKVDARILREVLEKYGELKYFDVSRPRNCAFVEFADPAGYAAAVAANPHDVGGEPISVEERRPRPGQFGNNAPSFNRGGANAGRGRGGNALQNRTGSQGGFQKEGRGGFSQRGAKPGNVTPKGRGQAQAA